MTRANVRKYADCGISSHDVEFANGGAADEMWPYRAVVLKVALLLEAVERDLNTALDKPLEAASLGHTLVEQASTLRALIGALRAIAPGIGRAPH